MDEFDFYDTTDYENLKVGDKIGKLKHGRIINIIEKNSSKKFTVTYKGKTMDNLTNKYIYTLKENIKTMDYSYFIRKKRENMDNAMKNELNQFMRSSIKI
jgi:hypothetical protein